MTQTIIQVHSHGNNQLHLLASILDINKLNLKSINSHKWVRMCNVHLTWCKNSFELRLFEQRLFEGSQMEERWQKIKQISKLHLFLDNIPRVHQLASLYIDKMLHFAAPHKVNTTCHDIPWISALIHYTADIIILFITRATCSLFYFRQMYLPDYRSKISCWLRVVWTSELIKFSHNLFCIIASIIYNTHD